MQFVVKIFVATVLGYQLLSSYGVCGTEDCRAKLDLVIILDSSLSVGLGNFKKVTAFIKSVIGHLPIQPDAVRVGVVRYATDVTVISYLDQDVNKTEKMAAVQGMGFRPGSTYTHLALQNARTKVLTPERGDRPDVPNLIILTTDGASKNQKWTQKEAMILKENSDLKIFVIGIGKEVVDDELVNIASLPEMVYKLTDFSQLTAIVGKLARFSCSDMKENSISDLHTWSNSEPAVISFTRTGTSASTASASSSSPQTTSTVLPSTVLSQVLARTLSTSSSTSLLLKPQSTLEHQPSEAISLSTLEMLTETTFPSATSNSSSIVESHPNSSPSTTQNQNSNTDADITHSTLTTTTQETSTEAALQQTTLATTTSLRTTLNPTSDIAASTDKLVLSRVTNVNTNSTDAPSDTTIQAHHDTTELASSLGFKHRDYDQQTITNTEATTTQTASTFTTTKESHLADTNTTTYTPSNTANVTDFSIRSAGTIKSFSKSSVSHSDITSTSSLVIETTSLDILTQTSIVDNSESTFDVHPTLMTNETSDLTTGALIFDNHESSVSYESTSLLSQTSTVDNQTLRLFINQTSNEIHWTRPESAGKTSAVTPRTQQVLESQTSIVSTRTSRENNQTQNVNSTESSIKAQRTSEASHTTTAEEKIHRKSSTTSTPSNTIIVEYETLPEDTGIDLGNDLNKTEYDNKHKHGEHGGDISSRDLYIFVAGGSAGAVILTAAATFMALLCRRRKNNQTLTGEV